MAVAYGALDYSPVEPCVTVPDYTAALDEYSRPIRALQAVNEEQAG